MTRATDYGAVGSASEADNRLRWDGRPGRYEVWFATFNHRASGTGYWIRHTLSAPVAGRGAPYAQLWFARFDGRDPERSFAINRKHPVEALRTSPDPFEVAVGEAVLGHGFLRGAIAGDGHTAEWDLSFTPAEHGVLTLPDWAYATERTDTKFLSPHFSVPFQGRLVADGEEYHFTGDRGTQCHIWGRKHAHTWAWGHACDFDGDEGTAVDVLSVRLKKGPITLPRLTLVSLQHGGEELRFSSPGHLALGQGAWQSGHFRFTATGPTAQVEGEFSARPVDLVSAQYTDPDGETAFCNNSEVADLELVIRRRTLLSLSWWREAARLRAPGRAHFEYAARAPDPAVTRRHVTV